MTSTKRRKEPTYLFTQLWWLIFVLLKCTIKCYFITTLIVISSSGLCSPISDFNSTFVSDHSRQKNVFKWQTKKCIRETYLQHFINWRTHTVQWFDYHKIILPFFSLSNTPLILNVYLFSSYTNMELNNFNIIINSKYL